MAVADGYLWVVGSHDHKRKNAKPERSHADNAKRLAKLALDGNRRLLACFPIELDAKGEPCLVREAKDGRRAKRLKGDAEHNQLTRTLADDPHFGPYMAIPGKDNGFDIEAGADLVMGGHIHLPYLLPLQGLARPMWAVQAGAAISSRVRAGVPNRTMGFLRQRGFF